MTDYKKLYDEIDQIQDPRERLTRFGELRCREYGELIDAGPPPPAAKVQSPDEMMALMRVQNAYVTLNRTPEAAALFKPYLAPAQAGHYPEVTVHVNFAVLYQQAGDHETARAFVATALKLDVPGSREADLRKSPTLGVLFGR